SRCLARFLYAPCEPRRTISDLIQQTRSLTDIDQYPPFRREKYGLVPLVAESAPEAATQNQVGALTQDCEAGRIWNFQPCDFDRLTRGKIDDTFLSGGVTSDLTAEVGSNHNCAGIQ